MNDSQLYSLKTSPSFKGLEVTESCIKPGTFWSISAHLSFFSFSLISLPYDKKLAFIFQIIKILSCRRDCAIGGWWLGHTQPKFCEQRRGADDWGTRLGLHHAVPPAGGLYQVREMIEIYSSITGAVWNDIVNKLSLPLQLWNCVSPKKCVCPRFFDNKS